MPSWPDGETSSEERLGDFVDMDYAPDTCEDPTFHGLAVGCAEVCRVHKLVPQKCVAFEGPNTGRRFYMCSVGNEVMNCGFHSWVDAEEWPETLQNALRRLWSMYFEANRVRISERVENANLVKQLSDDKNKMEKKYYSLLDDVQKFTEETEKKVLAENYKRIMQESEETEKERSELKNEVEQLKNEVIELKNLQRAQAEVMKGKQQKWDSEKDVLKEEKRSLEYMLYDLFKSCDSLKDKVKLIKNICDE